MHSKIPHWIDDLNAITATVQSEFGHLSADQLNWKPHPGKWSIAQVLDHLIVINGTYFPILESLKAGTFKKPFLGRFPFVYNFFGNFILRSAHPNNRRKTNTYRMWEPSSSTIAPDIIDRFARHQQTLIEEIRSCTPFLEKNTVIHSPLSRVIPYRLEQAFEIMVTHEKRHLNQAREVKQALLSSEETA